MPPPLSPTAQSISRLVREDWGRILSVLVKDLNDLALAEDCLQDATESALTHWHKNGLPTAPAAWLIKTARRKAIDRFRRAQTAATKAVDIAYLRELDVAETPDIDPLAIPDKRLELIFTCCHPALASKTQIALTLKTIGGLSVEDIAAGFLDKPTTMAARLTRAKKKIAGAGIPYAVPPHERLPERLAAVLGVIYMIFNEGYAATSGAQLNRVDLSDEAIRLARVMNYLMPETPEIEGLLALLLLHDARRPARTDKDGALVPLEHQDRSRWNGQRREEGLEILDKALHRGQAGPYQIQASISALHCQAPSWTETDWPQIAQLYAALFQMMPTDVVRVNGAMAVSYAETPAAGLAQLESLSGREDYVPYLLAMADLYRRTGDLDRAKDFLIKAESHITNDTERAYVAQQRARLEGSAK